MANPGKFSFFRAGGFDQVRFDSGEDLLALDTLDQKLWVALACPTKGLALDARTLELIDADKDGRIRAPELIAAAKWAGRMLKTPDDLMKGYSELPLASINLELEEGRLLHQAAKAVLEGLGRREATSISVADTAEAAEAFDALPFNGDGVVPPESAGNPEVKKLVEDVLACVGGAEDKRGNPGITADRVDAFFKAVAEHAAWLDRAQGELLPLGDRTAPAFEALADVRAKVDDFFARGRLAAFDERAAAALNAGEKEYLALASQELHAASPAIRALPLARVSGARPLPLSAGLNPAWAGAVAALASKVVEPLLGPKSELAEAEWESVKARFATYEAWQRDKAGAAVERLGAARVRALSAAGARAPLDALLAEEKAQEPTAKSIASVEKLVRLARDLARLANNFVSFREFYERKVPAIFQAGTLYLDQRACELCIGVEDASKHAAMAPLSRAYLAYCDCLRPATGQKMTIAAAMTAGDAENLMVGRNGIFYDRDGNDWDATITRLVDNPISIRQAFWAPYKKAVRLIEEQVAKRAASSDAAANERLTGTAAHLAEAAETGKVDPAAPKKLDVGVVAALGVAVGGITAAVGALLQTFFGLGLWMPLGVLGLLLLISGPSMLIAWLKLRQRNIGPLLDANGWAVNANARINLPFGASLTRVAALPKGARVDTVDPFAEVRRPWATYGALVALMAIAAGWYLGRLDGFLPLPARSVSVMGVNAPAYAPAPKGTAVASP